MKKERHTDPTEYSLHLFQTIEINFSLNVKLRFRKTGKVWYGGARETN